MTKVSKPQKADELPIAKGDPGGTLAGGAKTCITEIKRCFGAPPEELEYPEDAMVYLEFANRAAMDRKRLKWIRKSPEVDLDDIDAAMQETFFRSKGIIIVC